MSYKICENIYSRLNIRADFDRLYKAFSMEDLLLFLLKFYERLPDTVIADIIEVDIEEMERIVNELKVEVEKVCGKINF